MNRKRKYVLLTLKVISPVKGSRWQWAVSIIFGILLAIPIGISIKTVSIAAESIEIINNIFLAFVAMEMGAYALFQALLSDQLIWELYKEGDLLKDSNESFLGVILLFWREILINLFLVVALKVIPEDFLLLKSVDYSNRIAIGLLFIYYTISMRIMFEVRNFAINLYKVFVAYNKITILKMIKKNEKK